MNESLADVAKRKYPLVYEASLDIENAGLLPVNEVLQIIIDKYDLHVKQNHTAIWAMAKMEEQLEALYSTYEDEPIGGQR